MGHVDDLVKAETWKAEEGHESVLISSIQVSPPTWAAGTSAGWKRWGTWEAHTDGTRPLPRVGLNCLLPCPICAQLFAYIKKSLKRCTGLTKGQTLLSLYHTFQRVLRAYASRLVARLPKTSSGQTAGTASNTSTDWQVRARGNGGQGRAERMGCQVLSCHDGSFAGCRSSWTSPRSL